MAGACVGAVAAAIITYAVQNVPGAWLSVQDDVDVARSSDARAVESRGKAPDLFLWSDMGHLVLLSSSAPLCCGVQCSCSVVGRMVVFDLVCGDCGCGPA